MSYIAPIQVEDAAHVVDRNYVRAIESHYAIEAAKILFARSPTHAGRFALAMHKRVARGLDADVIEHWARVVTELGRIAKCRMAAE
jgi:hypothetical protein